MVNQGNLKIDCLFDIQKNHSNKIIMVNININFFANECSNMITNRANEDIDILMNSEAALDKKFAIYALCHLQDFSNLQKFQWWWNLTLHKR